MDDRNIDSLEREVTEHVHAQLGEYSRRHYTLDYQDFTTECIAEFLDELQCAPLTDPNALKLPEDPMRTLYKLKDIEALPPYEEPDRTSSEAISLLKAVQAQMRKVPAANLRSGRVAEFILSRQHVSKPLSSPNFMLTAKARRHNRQIGKAAYKKDVPTGFKTLKTTHISAGLPHLEEPADPKLPVDALLKIQWEAKETGLRAALESMIKLQKSIPKYEDQHYIDKFSLTSEPSIDIPETRFQVLFPRSRQPGYRPEDTTKPSLDPETWKDLKTLIPFAESAEAPSSDDFPTQNMRLIDGWQAICSSPPSSPDSPRISDEDLTDELCYPPTPDTDPPLVEDILRPKLEIPLFPRSRKPGGRDGVQPSILKEHKTLATFLPSLLPPQVRPRPEGFAANSPVPATSVLGQASLVDVEVKPDPEDDVDVEIEYLCKDAIDPFALIMEETVDDKSIPLMELPSMPEPTERNPEESSWIPRSLGELVTANTVTGSQLARPLVKKAPAKQSITLALSWSAITTDEQLPPLTQILDIESPLNTRNADRHAAMLLDVEQLLSKCSITESVTASDPTLLDHRLLSLVETLPPPKDPFKQPTLALSRLERQRLKRKRKLDTESQGEREDEDMPQGEKQPGTPNYSSSAPQSKRARMEQGTGFTSAQDDDDCVDQLAPDTGEARHQRLSPGHLVSTVGGASLPHQEHQLPNWNHAAPDRNPTPFNVGSLQDLGDLLAPTHFNAYSEANKENWDPSSEFGSDPLLNDPQGFLFDENMAVDDSFDQVFAHDLPEDDGFGFNSQMPLDGLEFKKYAEAAFEPLMIDTQHWDDPLRWEEPPSVKAVSVPPPLPTPLPGSTGRGTPIQRPRRADSSPLVSTIDPSRAKALFNHSLGLFEFANLRSVKLSRPHQEDIPEPQVDQNQAEVGTQPIVPPPEALTKHAVPTEILDGSTISIEEVNSRLGSCKAAHHYLASLEILQKRALVKALRSSDCFIDLVERTTLNGAHLILDPFTAVMFIPVLTLGAHCESWIKQLSIQSWRFSRIYVIFEAYPESCAVKSQERRSELDAYTPPILKAIKKFRRDIGLAEAFNTKSTDCRIVFGFADSVSDAARFVRYAGDTAEAGDQTGGEIWGDREWLDEEHEDEQDLASVAGMNHFSAALVLSQIDLEEFLKMEPQDRLNQFGGFVGADTISALNDDIAQRYERLSSVGDSDHYLDAADEQDNTLPMYY